MILDILRLSLFIFAYLCLYWAISSYLWLSRAISDYIGLSWANSWYLGLSRVILSYLRLEWATLAISCYIWIILSIIKYQGAIRSMREHVIAIWNFSLILFLHFTCAPKKKGMEEGTNRQTDWVTTSLLELLMAAKNNKTWIILR